MQPKSGWLLDFAVWSLTHKPAQAMRWYNGLVLPLGLFLQRPLAWSPGLIDVANLALPYSATGIETVPLYDEVFRVVVPAKHPWARRKSVSADELESENLLLLSIGHCFRDQVLEACREFTRPAPPGKEGNSLETVRSMVASGLGVSVLPASALTTRYANPLLKVLDFVPPRPSRRVVLAYRADFPRKAAIQAIVRSVPGLGLPVTPTAV